MSFVSRSTSGSALLLLVLVMTMMIILTFSCWRSTTYDFALALERVAYQQQFQATQGLLEYGVSFARLNYDNLGKRVSAGMLTIPFISWPPTSDKGYQATLSFTATSAGLLINAQVVNIKQSMTHLSCLLERIIKNDVIDGTTEVQAPEKMVLQISQWKIHDSA